MKRFELYVILILMSGGNLLLAGPPKPPGGGGGSTTPGAPASPIDMYVYLLMGAAVVLVMYYAKRFKNQIN